MCLVAPDPSTHSSHPPLLAFLFTTAPPPQFYTLSLHDALPISLKTRISEIWLLRLCDTPDSANDFASKFRRSEEHTSELQSRGHLVCRLLLEKKNTTHPVSTRPNIR